MNPVQMAQQIKHELQRVVWPVTGGEVVFGAQANAVTVHGGGPSSPDQIPATWPWAMVAIDGGSVDENEPNLVEQTFRVIVAAKVFGGPRNENAVIGGSRPDATTSNGRGVGELIERAATAVGNLNGVDGCKMLLSSTSTVGPVPIAGKSSEPCALGELVVSGWCTMSADYASPQNLRRDGNAWVWDGSHCSSRFDFVQFRLVRKQGQEPSLDPSNGTTVFQGAAADTTRVEATELIVGQTYRIEFVGSTNWVAVGAAPTPTPAVGTQFTATAVGTGTGRASLVASGASGNTYTVFADYNPRGGSTVEASSIPETGAWKVY